MKIYKWTDFIQLTKEKKSNFIGILSNKDNVVSCYEPGEERKYAAALRKQKKNTK